MSAQDPPTLDHVASEIAGGKPPDWLTEALPAFVTGLAEAIRSQAKYPGRPSIRNRLAALAKAACLIEKELNDPVILSLLLGDDRRWADDENATMRGLSAIASLANRASKKVRTGQGKDKHWPRLGGLPTMTLCALIVTMMWHEAQHRWPGQDNQKAQRACEGLWRIASGAGRRQSVAVWRDHLRDARAYRDKPEGKAILRGAETASTTEAIPTALKVAAPRG